MLGKALCQIVICSIGFLFTCLHCHLDHVCRIAMEQQIISWVKDWFDFPATAGAVFVTGSSQANFMVLSL